ncbi:hypothetical protein D3C71_624490 [compost metagenome]
MAPYVVVSDTPTVPAAPPKLTPVTGTPLPLSAPSRSLAFTLPLTVSGTASSVMAAVSSVACGVSLTMSTVSVPLATSPSRSVTDSAICSVTSVSTPPERWLCGAPST